MCPHVDLEMSIFLKCAVWYATQVELLLNGVAIKEMERMPADFREEIEDRIKAQKKGRRTAIAAE